MMKLEAFAKINLFLAVTGKRADGYHEIDTVMQRIGLADTVPLEKAPEGIAFVCDDPECIEKARVARGGPGGHMKRKAEGKPIIPQDLEPAIEDNKRV